VVALTGDLVDGPVKVLGDAVEPLARIKSRYGKYFVSGKFCVCVFVVVVCMCFFVLCGVFCVFDCGFFFFFFFFFLHRI
jgi:hypothetical protein